MYVHNRIYNQGAALPSFHLLLYRQYACFKIFLFNCMNIHIHEMTPQYKRRLLDNHCVLRAQTLHASREFHALSTHTFRFKIRGTVKKL